MSRTMIVPLIVASALFMENLDGTVIATALPQMAVTFGTTPIQLSVGNIIQSGRAPQLPGKFRQPDACIDLIE